MQQEPVKMPSMTPPEGPEEHKLKKKPETMTRIILKKFFKNKLAVVGGIVLLIIVTMAVFAPLIAPQDPRNVEMDLLNRLAPPSTEFIMGTDDFGRDIFSRVLYGARVSLLVGFLAMLGGAIIGTVMGSLAGYFGGRIDNLIMRLVDILISFPNIFLLILLIAFFSPSVSLLIIFLASLGWMSTARLVRGEFLSLREREYVLAAKTLGMRTNRIIFNHILPNALGPIIVASTLSVGNLIIVESVLSFLGLGVQPPTPSWGNMLQSAQNYTIMRDAWWYPVFPGLMIFITVLSINFVGDGLRDAFDPKIRS
ncbi:oligopeptide ABC transporter permease [Salipaludibacillus agaradhaerens]